MRALAKQLEGSNQLYIEEKWWENYKLIPHALCKLSLDEDSGLREGAIQALMKIAEDGNQNDSIRF